MRNPQVRCIISGLLLVYVLMVPTGCVANLLVLGANHDTIDHGSAQQKILQIDGRAVECWVARSPGAVGREPAAFSLMFTGKGGRVDQWIVAVANAWEDKPIEVWGMNYPGSGGSDGPVELKLVSPTAVGAYDALRKVAGSRPIFLQGASFGSAVSLSVAARRPVAGLILHNPPPLKQLILGNYGWWNLWLVAGPVAMQIPDDLDAIANARATTAPCVFILSGADHLVPPRYQQLVVRAYGGPARIIDLPGLGHDAGLPHEAAEELGRDQQWLWDAAGIRSPAESKP